MWKCASQFASNFRYVLLDIGWAGSVADGVISLQWGESQKYSVLLRCVDCYTCNHHKNKTTRSCCQLQKWNGARQTFPLYEMIEPEELLFRWRLNTSLTGNRNRPTNCYKKTTTSLQTTEVISPTKRFDNMVAIITIIEKLHHSVAHFQLALPSDICLAIPVLAMRALVATYWFCTDWIDCCYPDMHVR